MTQRNLHRCSGILLSVFIGMHLANHVSSLWGAESHIRLMEKFRAVYRHPVAEMLLMLAITVQVITGIRLYRQSRGMRKGFFEKLHIRSGLYLAFFLPVHVSAVWMARVWLKLDTNYYFGVAGMQSFPANLFFLPYYAIAVMAFFAHVASVHAQKMRYSLGALTPTRQAVLLLILGGLLSFLLIYGLTNGFRGDDLPEAYRLFG